MYFYLTQQSGVSRFPYRVEQVFESKEELKQHIVSGQWAAGLTGDETEIFKESFYLVVATKRIGVMKCIPAQYISAHSPLTEARDPEVRRALNI